MRRILIVLALLFMWLPMTGRSVSNKKEFKKIEGTWIPVTAELAGQPFPDAVLKTMKLVIKDGKYTVTVGDQLDIGDLKIDPTTKLKAIDIIGTEGPNKGKTILAIYKLKGDTLLICYDLGGANRPKEFKTAKGTQLFLVNYQRMKNSS